MPLRVLIAQFKHETNTFSKLSTTLDDYRKRWLIEGDAMVPRFKGTREEIAQALGFSLGPKRRAAALRTR